MTKKPAVMDAHDKAREAQAQRRRDYMAGTQGPYYGLLCDALSLRCLAEGVVPARLRLMAHDLLTGEDALATSKE
jgi:hypothetical protein